MCRRVTCETCQKPTYAGCGRHVEQVLIAVPEDARCNCRKGHAAAAHNQSEVVYAVSA